MRVLILSQWFHPEPNLVGTSLAKGLRDLGHEVQVLTGFPNYPGGKVYPGYRVKVLQRETFDGIPVIRVPLYPSHDASSIRRIINYTSFAFSAATIGVATVETPDVVYVYHPPATIGLPAQVLQWFRRVPFVYHIQDLWPNTLTATGMVNSGIILSLVEKWCLRIYKSATKLMVLSPGFKRKLVERGVPEEKIHVVYNWKDESLPTSNEVDDSVFRIFDHKNRFNIVFAGNMGKAQALESVIDAAALIEERYPKIRFIFVGTGVSVDQLKEYAGRKGLNNVVFLPHQPRNKIDAILKLADALLVHLRNDPLFSITVPSKTQAYLSVGKPILMGVSGDAADLVMQAGAGVCCVPEDPKSIADAAVRLYGMSSEERLAMGQRGQEFYREHLSMQRGIEKIASILATASVAH